MKDAFYSPLRAQGAESIRSPPRPACASPCKDIKTTRFRTAKPRVGNVLFSKAAHAQVFEARSSSLKWRVSRYRERPKDVASNTESLPSVHMCETESFVSGSSGINSGRLDEMTRKETNRKPQEGLSTMKAEEANPYSLSAMSTATMQHALANDSSACAPLRIRPPLPDGIELERESRATHGLTTSRRKAIDKKYKRLATPDQAAARGAIARSLGESLRGIKWAEQKERSYLTLTKEFLEQVFESVESLRDGDQLGGDPMSDGGLLTRIVGSGYFHKRLTGFSPSGFVKTLEKSHPPASVISQCGHLIDVDIPELQVNTGYDRRQLFQFFIQFKALVAISATPQGIDKKTFREAIPLLMLEDKLFSDRVFEALDADGSEIIEWDEFIEAMSKLERGTREERAAFLFSVYDEDGGGSIDTDEVKDYFRASLRASGDACDETTEELTSYLVGRVFDSITTDEEIQLEHLFKYIQERPNDDIYAVFGRSMTSSNRLYELALSASQNATRPQSSHWAVEKAKARLSALQRQRLRKLRSSRSQYK